MWFPFPLQVDGHKLQLKRSHAQSNRKMAKKARKKALKQAKEKLGTYTAFLSSKTLFCRCFHTSFRKMYFMMAVVLHVCQEKVFALILRVPAVILTHRKKFHQCSGALISASRLSDCQCSPVAKSARSGYRTASSFITGTLAILLYVVSRFFSLSTIGFRT